MSDFDWNAEAVKCADQIGDEMFSAHRGAMPWREHGITIIFGNDGYTPGPGETDRRAMREVELIRAHLAERGIREYGFGVASEDGYTWAMLVASDDAQTLTNLTFLAWEAACDGSDTLAHQPEDTVLTGVQPSIAMNRILEHSPAERGSMN